MQNARIERRRSVVIESLHSCGITFHLSSDYHDLDGPTDCRRNLPSLLIHNPAFELKTGINRVHKLAVCTIVRTGTIYGVDYVCLCRRAGTTGSIWCQGFFTACVYLNGLTIVGHKSGLVFDRLYDSVL